MRCTNIVLSIAVVAACGSKEKVAEPPAKGSAVVAVHDAALPDARVDEPISPPPAPTVKAGGKGDCKLEYAPRPTRDPNPMCRVPAARFTMGAPPGKDDDRFGQRPAFEVSLSPFYIDQFEVTVAQVAHYLNSVKDNRCPTAGFPNGTCFCVKRCWPGDTTLEGDRFVSIEGRDRLPAMHVSLEGAQRYCAWAGKALPTEAQWEAAARFDPATGKVRDYPWGSSYEPNRAEEQEGQLPVGSFDGTGNKLDGSSPVGVHDLAGSVSERIDGCWADYPLCPSPPCVDPRPAPLREECSGVVRSSGDGPQNTRGTARQSWAIDSSSGFRCARRIE